MVKNQGDVEIFCKRRGLRLVPWAITELFEVFGGEVARLPHFCGEELCNKVVLWER
jgi:hypothetical protein